jgi:pyruvate-formate lyase-activating enzyme
MVFTCLKTHGGIEAHRRGIFNIFVSNGYDTPESVNMMSKFLDCITADFKGSGKHEFVRQYIGIPSAEPIFQTLKEIKYRTTSSNIPTTTNIAVISIEIQMKRSSVPRSRGFSGIFQV